MTNSEKKYAQNNNDDKKCCVHHGSNTARLHNRSVKGRRVSMNVYSYCPNDADIYSK